MRQTGDDVAGLIARSSPAIRRRDAETLTALMQEISGREPAVWGTIIGFGQVHYRYPTGTEGDTGLLGFAPRKAATTIYLLDGVDAHGEDLARLGPHTTGVGCLYLADLERVDLDVLRRILERSLAWVEAGGSDGMQLTVTARPPPPLRPPARGVRVTPTPQPPPPPRARSRHRDARPGAATAGRA